MRLASVGCFPGAWRRGSWHFQVASLHLQSSMDFSFSASHHFSFLSKRSGRRMPPAERIALYKHTWIFSERARLAPPWPLTSSHLNTASFYYLLDLSSFSLLSTLFLYLACSRFLLRTYAFSFFHLFSFFVHKGSSSSNTTTNRNTATTR